jgi:ABC-type transport system involved in multi-copper enzyme maturation permease subunit
MAAIDSEYPASPEALPNRPLPNRPLPQLRSELSRLTHRRFFRLIALLLIGGIVLVSVVIFVKSSKTDAVPVQAQQAYAQYVHQYEHCSKQFSNPQHHCPPAPGSPDAPTVSNFFEDPQYHASANLPAAAFGAGLAAAAVAFLIGATTGGAEWSSRSMSLQLLWEPRRLRLLALKWLALILVVAVLAALAIALALMLGAITATLHGDWTNRAPGFWLDIVGTSVRALGLSAVTGTFAYAIAMLVRNTGGAIGVGFVYFAVLENGIRLAFHKYTPDQYLLSTNSVAWLMPDGLTIPRYVPPSQSDFVTSAGPGALPPISPDLHIDHVRSIGTLAVYVAVAAALGIWSFTRRDVA